MQYRVIFSLLSKSQLSSIEDYITDATSEETAAKFIDAIIARCEALYVFPNRGTPRDDIRPGTRTLVFRRNVTIAYNVLEDRVIIAGVFYGGQDYATILAND